MMKFDVLSTDQPAAWMRILEQCAPHDFYHLPQYHAMAEEAGDGTAQMFSFSEGDITIALPLLLRPLDGDLYTPTVGAGWRDASSVYGYPGPIASHRDVPAAVVRNFQAALESWLRDLRVTAVFSRLNPLLNQRHLLAGLGECQVSSTVAIDLTAPPDVQRSRYRKSHREAINRLRRLAGLTIVHDQGVAYLPDFIHIYHETMRRVEAAERYFFPPAYFERLREILGADFHLFLAYKDGKALCGGLLIACHGILQYHLSGTLNEALKLGPMKLLIDEARLWAMGQGLCVMHLGGGGTSDPADPLLYFKTGFSDRTHEFAVWRWVLFPDVYRQLCEHQSQWNERHNRQPAVPNFFPQYRCPTVARTQPAVFSPAYQGGAGGGMEQPQCEMSALTPPPPPA